MKKLNKYLKVISVGSGFVLFGLICTLGNFIFVPLMLLSLDKRAAVRKYSRFFVCNLWKFFLKYLACIRFISYEIIDFHLIKKRSNLILANHPSLLDVVFLLSYIPGANCIVKSALRKNIFLYPAIKCSGYILNTQNEEFLQNGINALKNGENLIIFPEGTRTKEKIIFHKAASYMALKGADFITPLLINMHPISLRKGQKWYKTPDEKIIYKIKVLSSLSTKELLGSRAVPAVARELNQNLIKLYEKEYFNERIKNSTQTNDHN